ncbi:MAG: DNA replication and repair protein RecF [Verrucomicrobiota bacterium]|nr:DNA replication and repair protein RecF [Verrucomicrobiota bacterium]
MTLYLHSLALRNFRNFKAKEVLFAPGINQIWGDNGQGKSTLLEAIHLLSTGRSFRTQHFAEMIREGEKSFSLHAEYEQEGRKVEVELFFDGKKKELRLDATRYSSFQPLLGLFPLIVHMPHDAALIEGAPALRRRLMNFHLSQSDSLYFHHLARFWRAMKQRNVLLKKEDDLSIACWEEEMAPSALYLLEKRAAWVLSLYSPLLLHSGKLSEGKEEHLVRYHPSFTQNYRTELTQERSRAKELGFTLRGPHRDDISFWIGTRKTPLFGSEGQKKTAILALKLAEWESLAKQKGTFPLFAIDDLGLPLDPGRLHRFYEELSHLGQVWITAPTALGSFPSHQIHLA